MSRGKMGDEEGFVNRIGILLVVSKFYFIQLYDVNNVISITLEFDANKFHTIK